MAASTCRRECLVAPCLLLMVRKENPVVISPMMAVCQTNSKGGMTGIAAGWRKALLSVLQPDVWEPLSEKPCNQQRNHPHSSLKFQ